MTGDSTLEGNAKSEYAQKECPLDRCACRYEMCEGGCVRLTPVVDESYLSYVAEASEIATGLGWLGFWVGLGLLLAAWIKT
jgi:hypothetical protein